MEILPLCFKERQKKEKKVAYHNSKFQWSGIWQEWDEVTIMSLASVYILIWFNITIECVCKVQWLVTQSWIQALECSW